MAAVAAWVTEMCIRDRQVDKMDYSKHPEAKYLRSCKASAHVPEWRRLEEEAAKTPQPAPKPAPAAKKPAKRKATKPASPIDKSPKEAPAPKSAGTPEGIITICLRAAI